MLYRELFVAKYIPCWDEDVRRFFSKAPDEFALFYWLLRSAHLKNEAYKTLITGSLSKSKEKYKKEWAIFRGDVLTSKTELSSIWGFHRTRSIPKILASLVEKKLIAVLLEEPTLIVKIKNFEYFMWAGKSKDRPTFVYEDSHTAEKVVQMDQGGDHSVPGGDPNNIPAAQNDSVFVQNGSLLITRTKIKKEEGGEFAREREGDSPHFLNSFEEIEIGERVKETPISPLSKIAPPIEFKALNEEREGNPIDKGSESSLNAFVVYEMYSKELLATRNIPIFSPTSKDLKTAEFLIQELKTIENINLAIRRYALTDKDWYEKRAWSLELLKDDLREVYSSKVIEKKEAEARKTNEPKTVSKAAENALTKAEEELREGIRRMKRGEPLLNIVR